MTAQSDDRLSVPVGAHDHTQGPATARITLVQYGDYECPYSRQARPFVQDLQQASHVKRSGNQVDLNDQNGGTPALTTPWSGR